MPAKPLKLISSMAIRELLVELVIQYQNATAQPVITEAVGGVDVVKRVQLGEAVDLVILSSNAIDKLIAGGRLLSDSRVDLVSCGVAIAVRVGALKPDVSNEEALKRAVLTAKSLSYSTGPSGVHLEKLFERWGVLQQIRSRIVVPPPGTAVGSLVASGAAELGFQQLSELISLTGIEIIGPLPPALQTMTIFSGGIGANCAQPETARALLQFMASAATRELTRRYGMQVV